MPYSTYPRTNTSGLLAGTTAEAADVLNAVTPLDQAIEDLRVGRLEFAQMRLDPGGTLTVTAGAITITGSHHLITASPLAVLGTINGANQGQVIYLERASGSADIIVGDYLLGATGEAAWIVKKASGFEVLASSGRVLRCAFRAYRSGSQQVIASSVSTKIQYNATSYNQVGPAGTAVYDPTTNYRYSPGRVGQYQFDAQIIWATAMDAGALALINLVKNGSVVIQTNEFGAGATDLTCGLSAEDEATSTSDYYEIFVTHLGAGNKNIYAIAAQVWFCGIWTGEYIVPQG